MRIRYTLYTCLLLGVLSTLPSSAQELKWLERMASGVFSFGNVMTADQQGNVYITGYFLGDMNFGGTTLSGNGFGDIYLAKYNTSRQLQWVRRGTSPGWNGGRGIAIGNDGSVYLAGRIEETTEFDGMNVPSQGENDIVVAKYSSTGGIEWVKSAGGTGMDWANGIAVDASGNTYVSGYYSGSATFAGQGLNAAGDHDAFLAAYDPNGNLRWVRSIGGSGVDEGFGVAVDSHGDVYTIGIVTGTASFGGTTFQAGGTAGFLAKYSSDGTFRWVKGSPGTSTAESISMSRGDTVIIAGSFIGSATFGGTSLTSAGSNDVYVARYNTSGDAIGAWNYGGAGQDGVAGFGQAVEVVASKKGGFYLTSSFEQSMVLGSTTHQSAGKADIFVGEFAKDGTPKWSMSGGGTDNDQYVSLGADTSGNAYLFGNYFSPTFTFGGKTITRFNSVDMFMAKIDGSTATGQPLVSVAPSSVAIGNVPTGATKNGSVTVRSGSNVPLVVTGVHFEDPQSSAAGFTITSPAAATLPATLSGSTTLTVSVTFSPTTVGPASAVIVVETNDPVTPSMKIPVSGTGQDGSLIPRAVIDVSKITIRDIPVGLQTTRSFFIRPGTVAGLTVENIEFEDTQSEALGFAILSPTTFPRTIAAGDSLEVVVGVTPKEEGSTQARIVITTNDQSGPFRNVDVIAQATEPAIAGISTTALDFGTVDVGKKGTTTFTISSLSATSLRIERATFRSVDSLYFSILSPSSFPVTIAGGSEITVTVSFTPAAEGTVDGMLTLFTSDPSLQQSEITLTGSGHVVPSSGVATDQFVAGNVMIYPSPISENGTISFSGQVVGEIEAALYNANGELIRTFDSRHHDGGKTVYVIDGTNLNSGMYYGRISINNQTFNIPVVIRH